MAPKGWTNPAEYTFLDTRIAVYLEAKKKKQLFDFFRKTYTDWFKAFPETDRLFPKGHILSAEEEKKLGAAVEMRHAVSSFLSLFIGLCNGC